MLCRSTESIIRTFFAKWAISTMMTTCHSNRWRHALFQLLFFVFFLGTFYPHIPLIYLLCDRSNNQPSGSMSIKTKMYYAHIVRAVAAAVVFVSCVWECVGCCKKKDAASSGGLFFAISSKAFQELQLTPFLLTAGPAHLICMARSNHKAAGIGMGRTLIAASVSAR